MKSVLISIQPKWCELIASGKKTVEVRKTKPKLETPFKVYIYMTKEYNRGINSCFYFYKNGKVIGEFVCDRITEYECSSEGHSGLATTCGTCLTYDEIINYCNGYSLFGWHISDLKIYDKPKELGEFRKPCIDKEHYCPLCPLSTELLADVTEVNEYGHTCLHRVKRPPQSWCYVEGLGEYGQ